MPLFQLTWNDDGNEDHLLQIEDPALIQALKQLAASNDKPYQLTGFKEAKVLNVHTSEDLAGLNLLLSKRIQAIAETPLRMQKESIARQKIIDAGLGEELALLTTP